MCCRGTLDQKLTIGATYLYVNLVFHSQMKHISIDYHFVQDHVTRGSFQVSHISYEDQLVDALTKALPLALIGLQMRVNIKCICLLCVIVSSNIVCEK